MRKFLIVGLMTTIVSTAPCAVSAACSGDVNLRLRMAISFYKDAVAYSNESLAAGDGNDMLAQSEWGNLKHELDVIGSDIVDCDEQAQQVYYLLETRMDLIDAEKTVSTAIFHREHPSPIDDVQAAYEQTDPTLVSSSLIVLSSHAGSLYLAHYANVKPADYASIKQTIKDLYARAGVPFKSWESTRP
jgi:hypothetical protein